MFLIHYESLEMILPDIELLCYHQVFVDNDPKVEVKDDLSSEEVPSN